MVERKESLPERFGVIFVIWDGKKLQLEKRIEPQDPFFGYTLIPGGKVKKGYTYEKAIKEEVLEEYDVEVKEFRKIGRMRDLENSEIMFRHIFLVTKWEGKLKNPEDRNIHLSATIKEARRMCKHPISQRILDYLEDELSI